MTAERFCQRIKNVVGDAEASDHDISIRDAVMVLQSEIARLQSSGNRYMHEMQETY